MVSFKGFQSPHKRIVLKNARFEAEVWPEVAGALARFELVEPGKAKRALTRQAPEGKAVYFAPDDMACFPLVPYSNRIGNGKMMFNGKEYDIPLDVEGHPHTLHGVGWQRPWDVVSATDTSCTLRLTHKPDVDWPFAFTSEMVYTLNDDGLTIGFSIKNDDASEMPYGFGLHPYVKCPQGTKLYAGVKGVWEGDQFAMPTTYVDLPEKFNLPAKASLDGVFMDHIFEHLSDDAKVLWPDGASLTVKGSDNLKYLVIYNPTDQDFVCVEPVSHMVDAFNRHARGEKNVGYTTLKTGEKDEGSYRFIFAPAA